MSYTLLHYAADYGNVDKARELLKHGRYDVNCRDGIGRTPLHWACIGGHVDMVRMLISEFQADTTLHNQSVYGDTPLHDAAWRGRGEVALTLITEFGCDTNLQNNDGYTSLHAACVHGHASVVRMVGRYASVLATDKNGDTPLHIAAARRHKECVEALLQLDAPILLRNAAGKTARDIAGYGPAQLLDAYITQNKAKLYAHYDIIMQQAKKKYSNAERITRVVILELGRAPSWKQ